MRSIDGAVRWDFTTRRSRDGEVRWDFTSRRSRDEEVRLVSHQGGV